MMKVQYSKILPIITGGIFIFTLYYCFANKGLDLSLLITVLSVTGGIFATTNIFYLKKSQLENTSKIKADTYRIAAEERYKYNEKMIQLKRKYQLTDAEIMEIESDSPMDEFESEALCSLTNTIDESICDASAPITNQNV